MDVTGFVEFPVSASQPVIVRVASSFISWDQAKQNLHNEADGDFDTVHQRVCGVWKANLAKIEIEATEDQKKTFYSCFYRAQMFPHRLYELDAAGRPIHYSPYDGAIHDGVLYGDTGIWDAFRTTFPLTTLLFPEQTAEILQGFVNASVEDGGMPPEWPSPGPRSGMIGQHCAAIFADAVVKGIKGFDARTAYENLKQCALEEKLKSGQGRKGMKDYLKFGYITPKGGVNYCVSCTLDYAYDDWCVAQMAKIYGEPEVAKTLMVRAKNYPILWDASVGFMRAKDADGKWIEPFDEFLWGGPYCESGAWQASWFVPHDPAGLTVLLGGRAAFATKLDQLFSLPPTYHSGPGGYPNVIHEMKEMVPLKMGQCALGNQPSFHIPYLYTAIGEPWKTQYWTRRACTELFNSSGKGFPGDEDTGSMASWYIFSSMGLYPFCPGTTEYILTSPLFEKAILHLPENKTLIISTAGNSLENVYIQKCLFRGREQSKMTLDHQDLTQGGELHFDMGPQPKIETIRNEDLPYSASMEK